VAIGTPCFAAIDRLACALDAGRERGELILHHEVLAQMRQIS
jgi:hypothetical protein